MELVKINKGYTLIELLVTLAIIGIVLSIYSTLYYSSYKSYVSTQKNIDIEQNVRYAMTYITNQINQNSNGIILSNFDNNIAHSITVINEDGNIKFSFNNNIIYREKNGIKNQLAIDIYIFNIKVITDKMINIEIGGKKDDGTGEFTLSTDIFLRKGNINVQQ